jgi:hypothetical protein
MGPATIEACAPNNGSGRPTMTLAAGAHVLRTAPGQDTAIQLDRLVLASDSGGGPLATGFGRVTGLPDRPPPAPKVTVVSRGRTKLHVQVSGADQPFWLVLGESQSAGWRATAKGGNSLGASQLVDGYANGWRIDPKGGNVVDLTLEWTPQRRVWTSLAVSLGAIVLALGLVVVSSVRRRARASVRSAAPSAADGDVDLVWPFTPLGDRTPRWAFLVGPLLGGAIAAVVVAPWTGVLVAVLVALALRFPPARAVLALAPPVLLGLAALYIAAKQQRYQLPPFFEWPTLFPRAETPAWLAIVLLSADAFVEWLRTPRRPLADAPIGQPVNGASEEREASVAAA